jgi:hypothetical protein
VTAARVRHLKSPLSAAAVHQRIEAVFSSPLALPSLYSAACLALLGVAAADVLDRHAQVPELPLWVLPSLLPAWTSSSSHCRDVLTTGATSSSSRRYREEASLKHQATGILSPPRASLGPRTAPWPKHRPPRPRHKLPPFVPHQLQASPWTAPVSPLRPLFHLKSVRRHSVVL